MVAAIAHSDRSGHPSSKDRSAKRPGGGQPVDSPRCEMAFRAPSDKDKLQLLQNAMRWTPGSENIRPNAKTLEHKALFDANLRRSYATTRDYILIELFDYPASFVPEHEGMMRVHLPRAERDGLAHRSAFEAQGFPYDLPAGTQHAVMWYPWAPSDGLSVAVDDR